MYGLTMAAYLTARDVAARWACSASYVRWLARSGRLPAMRLGSDWRFSPDAVEGYERRHTTTTAHADAMPKPEVSRREAPAILPADYEPVFADLWPELWPPRKSGPQR